jgi:Tol biopolymer transport system component
MPGRDQTLPFVNAVANQNENRRRQRFDFIAVLQSVAAVVGSEPSWDALPVTVSPTLRAFLRRSLHKDPKQRVGDIRDMRLALEGAFGSGVMERNDDADSRSASPRIWMAAAVVGVAAAVSMSVILREPAHRAQTLRFQITPPEDQAALSFALSPDGQRLAFTTGRFGDPAASRLWVRPLDSMEAQPLRGTEGASQPFWSPDSRTIGFFADGKLKKIDLLGGPPQIVCDAPFGQTPLLPNTSWSVQSGTWNHEGVILFTGGTAGERPLYRVSAASGEAQVATALEASRREIIHAWAQFLPDGRHFLYTAVSAVAGNSAVYAASLDSEETKRLLTSDANVAYAEDAAGRGYLLFLRGETLLAQRFDAAQLNLHGEPFPVAEHVAAVRTNLLYTSEGLRAQFSISAHGVLSYQRGGAAAKELVWFDRSGRRLSTVGEPADYSNLALSLDGRRLAISRMDPQLGTRDIWVFDLDRGGVSTKLTYDRGDEMNPVWSPDGQRIAFSSTRKGPRDLFVREANGTGEDEVLFDSGDGKSAIDWSSDGKYLLFNASGPVPFTAALDRERKQMLRFPPPHTSNPRTSPNGRWLAYQSNESGRLEIHVQSFPALLTGRSTGKWRVSIGGGYSPEWRRDGQELFYIAPDNTLMAVSVETSRPDFKAGVPTPLFPMRIETTNRRAHYQSAANGQRFLVVQLPELELSSPITVVVNWPVGLTR